jgi:hypothetical protein
MDSSLLFNFYPAHAMSAKLFRSMFRDTPAIELQRLGEEYAKLVSALSLKFSFTTTTAW